MSATVAVAALAAGWALTLSVSLALLRSERREAARERNLLLARLMHLAGRTWEQPPDDTPAVSSDPVPDELIRPSQHFSL